MTSIGVLISGSGTNLQSIIDAIEAGGVPGRIACVISNRADAFGLERARRHGIPALVISHRDHPTREDYDSTLVACLQEHGVELTVLAGFMRIITPVFLDAFPHRVMNIHPALLPAFPGIHAQRQALEYGVRYSGCTVHFVDSGTDTGPIILQSVVPVLPEDTEDSLSARIRAEEHRLYPEAVRLFCQGRLQVEGRHVIIADENPGAAPRG
jgi:phosphoribosylglycinamide formyltransferase-1